MAEAPPSTRSTRRRGPGGRHGVDHVPDLVAHRLDHGPGQVGPTGAPAEPDDGPPGRRVPVGAAEPGEGRDDDHPVAGLDRCGPAALWPGASSMMPSPSRSHWTPAPETKTDPSRA